MPALQSDPIGEVIRGISAPPAPDLPGQLNRSIDYERFRQLAANRCARQRELDDIEARLAEQKRQAARLVRQAAQALADEI